MCQRCEAYRVFFVILSFIFIASTVSAEWNNLRDYEPVVMRGNEFTSFLGQPVKQIFAFRYDAAGDQWHQIPIQIDEKDDSTHVWVPQTNGVLDANDEIVFMAKDMGDRVPQPWYWIENPESRDFERYEILATDPLTNEQRYLYFYLSPTIVDTTTGYMAYTPASGGYGTDVVFGASYIEGHNQKGIPDRWEIPVSAGGSGVDILDRQKARGFASALGGLIQLDVNEDEFTFVKIDTVIGKVRICRRLWLSIYGLYSFDLPMYYYPYSVDNKGASGTLDPTQVNVSHIRQSFDLSPEAAGMMFFNNFNDSVLIDGVADANIDQTIIFSPDVNWFLFTGNQGTVLTLVEMTNLGGTTRLYYWDNSAGGSDDGKADTGDLVSYGDTGILITGSGLEGRFSFSFQDYFLPANQLKEIGPGFVANYQNPLNLVKSSQLVPVELTTFDARVKENGVLLTWITASETDNYGFEVQRSVSDAKNWEKIGFVPGHNTTSENRFYQFFDKDVENGSYFYRLKQIDLDGAFHLSEAIEVNITIPTDFKITSVYPNPFNSSVDFRFILPSDGHVEVSIVDVLGRFVKSIYSGELQAGKRHFQWDGKDANGSIVSSGTYIVRIRYQSSNLNQQWRTTKVIFVK